MTTKVFSGRWALCLLGMIAPSVWAGAYEDCLLLNVMSSEVGRTAGEIREQCKSQFSTTTDTLTSTTVAPAPSEETAVERALEATHDIENRDFAISTFKPVYILATYNDEFDAADSIYADLDPKFAGFKQEEVKYQVSMKMPVWQSVFSSNNDIYAAYSQTSWWQLFADASDISAPFRETNYEPEIFLRHYSEQPMPFDGKLAVLDLGFVHQSNGRSNELSRSWNRVIGRAVVDYGTLALQARAWYRIPEDDDEDDNPNMQHYLGYGDIMVSWVPNKNTFSAMYRPGTKESGFELTWSYPISKHLRVYSQWYYGYGESLIDYDNKVNRIGIGVSINDWLMQPR